MNRKLLWVLLTAILLALPHRADAQQPAKIPRIGFLSATSPISARIEAFRQGLQDLGYVEGKNIVIEWRWAEGKLDHLPALAAALVRLKVDVVVADGSTPTSAAKDVTTSIPIVMTNSSDPVVLGFVTSLARPGGNITGLTNLAPELGGKRLELLKETVPKLSRVSVLTDPSSKSYGPQMKDVELAALALGLQLQTLELGAANDLEGLFSEMISWHGGAVIVLLQPALTALRVAIVGLAAQHRIPAMYPNTDFVDVGGLMCYAPNYTDLFRRAGTYVDKILKGAKPSDLPVEQPTKFELVINLKAAKQIGLTIPPNVLARADRVIR